ncbi:hypothetical protein TSUD_95310 [Trifolium subterraneum]|uniref:Uncharacterized protein n=1 Tax=Trifolium subterraneum TaxID=3900 RepID=A0A2Z6LSL1_TRISU|nr:hypothetical protein TSUD_95310 [Trifolium subterraneum]
MLNPSGKMYTVKPEALSTSDVKAEANIIFSASDVMSTYKDATLLPKWKAFQTVIFLERDDGLEDSSKIAAFDFDGCLANTSVKKVDANAWSLMYSSIPDKLQSLYNNGYKLVIFTNESNIDRWKNKRQKAVDSKIGRLNQFIEKVKVPIQEYQGLGPRMYGFYTLPVRYRDQGQYFVSLCSVSKFPPSLSISHDLGYRSPPYALSNFRDHGLFSRVMVHAQMYLNVGHDDTHLRRPISV